MTLLLSAASFIVVPWCSRTPKGEFYNATEKLGGTPVILWVRHHGIMKSVVHQVEI